MSTDRTLLVPAHQVEAVTRILRRSIATDDAELRRLTMLGTVYHDRPAGRDVDPELEAAKRRREVAEFLLAQLKT